MRVTPAREVEVEQRVFRPAPHAPAPQAQERGPRVERRQQVRGRLRRVRPPCRAPEDEAKTAQFGNRRLVEFDDGGAGDAAFS